MEVDVCFIDDFIIVETFTVSCIYVYQRMALNELYKNIH